MENPINEENIREGKTLLDSIRELENREFLGTNEMPAGFINYVDPEYLMHQFATAINSESEVSFGNSLLGKNGKPKIRYQGFSTRFEFEGEEIKKQLIVCDSHKVSEWAKVCIEHGITVEEIHNAYDLRFLQEKVRGFDKETEAFFKVIEEAEVVIVNSSLISKIKRFIPEQITYACNGQEQLNYNLWLEAVIAGNTSIEEAMQPEVISILASIARTKKVEFINCLMRLQGKVFERVIYDVLHCTYRQYRIYGKISWFVCNHFETYPTIRRNHIRHYLQKKHFKFEEFCIHSKKIGAVIKKQKVPVEFIETNLWQAMSFSDEVLKNLTNNPVKTENVSKEQIVEQLQHELVEKCQREMLYMKPQEKTAMNPLIVKFANKQHIENMYTSKIGHCGVCFEDCSEEVIAICCGFVLCNKCFANKAHDIRQCPHCRNKKSIPIETSYICIRNTPEDKSKDASKVIEQLKQTQSLIFAKQTELEGFKNSLLILQDNENIISEFEKTKQCVYKPKSLSYDQSLPALQGIPIFVFSLTNDSRYEVISQILDAKEKGFRLLNLTQGTVLKSKKFQFTQFE